MEEIYVLGKRVRLLQPEGGFRTSLDSVMLAAACPARAGERALDMGCGVGGAAFCLLRRVPGCRVTGVDIVPENVELARKNADLNEAEDRADFACTDIRAYEVGGPEDRFDHAICNPPYLESGTYTPSPDGLRAAALGHGALEEAGEGMNLSEWIGAGFRLLKSGGSLTIIHRADAVDRIVQALGRRFGAVEVIPLWPRAGVAAKRVIVRAVKDRRSPALLHPGLVLHEKDGTYSAAANAILSDMQAL